MHQVDEKIDQHQRSKIVLVRVLAHRVAVEDLGGAFRASEIRHGHDDVLLEKKGRRLSAFLRGFHVGGFAALAALCVLIRLGRQEDDAAVEPDRDRIEEERDALAFLVSPMRPRGGSRTSGPCPAPLRARRPAPGDWVRGSSC